MYCINAAEQESNRKRSPGKSRQNEVDDTEFYWDLDNLHKAQIEIAGSKLQQLFEFIIHLIHNLMNEIYWNQDHHNQCLVMDH